MTKLLLKIRLDISCQTNPDLMDNLLQQQGLLPTTSPFLPGVNEPIATIGNVATTGSKAVIDWVKLSLKDSNNNIIQTRSGLLLADGTVVSPDGVSAIRFNVPKSKYFISVKTRNTLEVTTLDKYSFKKNITLDLTNDTVDLAGQCNVEPKNGYFVLISGDLNSNGIINQVDVDNIKANSGFSDAYVNEDLNLDGSVDSTDISIANTNINKHI